MDDVGLEPERLTADVWQIDTETSTYIYDVDDAVVTRLPGGAGSLTGEATPRFELRKDHERIPVLAVSAPVVGQCWYLKLRVVDDRGWTLRRTTVVCHIVRLA